MNRNEIVTRVATATGAERAEVGATVDAVIDVIAHALRSGEDVRIARFGRFEVREIPERRGRNPRTGEPMTVAAYRRVAFVPFSELAPAPAAA